VILILFLAVSFLVPWPWNLVVVICGLAAEIGEVTWGLRLARKTPRTGAEAAVGSSAKVMKACKPEGLVRFEGELWHATCAAGADVGDLVRVTAVRGLTLEVVPIRRSAALADPA
jgi:membrane-bound serine protease (ClpP class)